MPDLPLIVLPHPLSSKPAEMIRALAEQTLDEVEFALVGNPGEVASRYHLRVAPYEPPGGTSR